MQTSEGPETAGKGLKKWRTPDGIFVIRLHYTADPDRDPETPAGKEWLTRMLAQGRYPGGIKGKAWKKEQEIDFTLFGGKSVYPQFSEEIHVAKDILVPVRGRPILRGWDFGLTPAASFSQVTAEPYWNIFPCLHTTGREGVGINTFAEEVVSYSNLKYPDFEFRDYADPSGGERSQNDAKTAFSWLAALGISPIKGVASSRTRDQIVQLLLERMVMGRPFFQVCPSALFMIEGFKGGFQYRQIGQTEYYTTDHEKNEYSHAMEALQYVASRVFNVQNPRDLKNRRGQVGFSNWSRRGGKP